MHQFYKLYATEGIAPQVVAQSDDIKFTPQVVAHMDIFKIPWGHHRFIMDKCKENRDKAIFYVEKTLEKLPL